MTRSYLFSAENKAFKSQFYVFVLNQSAGKGSIRSLRDALCEQQRRRPVYSSATSSSRRYRSDLRSEMYTMNRTIKILTRLSGYTKLSTLTLSSLSF